MKRLVAGTLVASLLTFTSCGKKYDGHAEDLYAFNGDLDGMTVQSDIVLESLIFNKRQVVVEGDDLNVIYDARGKGQVDRPENLHSVYVEGKRRWEKDDNALNRVVVEEFSHRYTNILDRIKRKKVAVAMTGEYPYP